MMMGVALAATTTGLQARTIQIEDYLNWEKVADPQISPDGKTVLYTRSHVNLQEDRFQSELWVVDADGRRNRRLLDKEVSEVAWSPDGTRIAYIAKADKSNEIFVRWMDAGGSVTQVTRGVNKPSSLSWSPDGKSIAFRAFVPAEQTWDIELPGKPAGAEWAEDAVVIDKLHYRYDGVGITPVGYHHIFVVPADSGTPSQLTEGDWNAGPFRLGHDAGAFLAWSPDGQSIIFSADREPGADLAVARSSLYAVDVVTRALRRITTSPESAVQPQISPNGKLIAYLGMDKTTESSFPSHDLHVVGIDGADDKILIADVPASRVTVHWAKNSRGLYYVHDKEGSHNIHYVSLGGKTKDITTGAQSLSLSSVSDKGVAVGTRTTVDKPEDVVRFDLATGRNMRWLTAVNEDVLQGVELGRVEEIWYGSTDNTRVQGWMIYPPDFDPGKKYPLILRIHGGPEAMYTGNFSAAAWDFTFQDYAAEGYVVLYINPRGSTGYSGDFTRAIYNAYPGRRDYEDLMHGVDRVVERGFVDEERMYVEGCSGGGTLTAWVVTQTDRFAGAAALCPIVNMISFAGSTDIAAWAYNRFKAPFWDEPEAWLNSSSIMRANKIKTPTLVGVGESDIRTPVGQSQELYTALKILGVPTKLILFKEESHGTWRKPSNMLRTRLYLRKWYSEWRRVAGEAGPSWVRTGPGE